MHSGVHQAVAADTPEPLEASASSTSWSMCLVTLDATATDVAYVGGPEVSVANAKGTPILPGQTLLLPPNGGLGTYTSSRVFVAFTSNAAAAGPPANYDRISFTFV